MDRNAVRRGVIAAPTTSWTQGGLGVAAAVFVVVPRAAEAAAPRFLAQFTDR
jgi:hypothetical protein